MTKVQITTIQLIKIMMTILPKRIILSEIDSDTDWYLYHLSFCLKCILSFHMMPIKFCAWQSV